ncbi:MAG: hypothetical protein AAF517_11775 [Planctomycetota bacterium]
MEKPHHLSVVIAGTREDDEDAFTLGFDYEYRVNELLGVGAVAEHAFEPVKATTLLAVADIHIWRGFAIQTGPGAFVGRERTHFVYRLGGLYEFDFDEFTFSPQIHYDFTETAPDGLVYAVAVGFAF